MNKRKSIRLRTTFFYLLKMGGAILLLILFLALIFFFAPHIIIKGIFGFYILECFAFYIYMVIAINDMEMKEYKLVENELKKLKSSECEIINFHEDTDYIVVIPYYNMQLMWEIKNQYAFLEENEWVNLYYHLCVKKDDTKKAWLIKCNSDMVEKGMLEKYYYMFPERDGVFCLM